jgi:hypothetical protein
LVSILITGFFNWTYGMVFWFLQPMLTFVIFAF